MYPKTIKLLGIPFEIKELSYEDLNLFGGEGKKLICDHYDIKERIIYLNRDLSTELKNYGLFHAIEEVLLSLLGQYYNHEGFQGFSFVVFATLCENNLGYLFFGQEE